MNRYNRGPTIGAPSKATASTLCQKCLKKGHYSFECKAVPQERPYVSRPSRTQQLFNPKLVPKLMSDVPQDLLRKKGVADEQLAKLEQERGRKRERQSEGLESPTASKRLRSVSSDSVSTISTKSSQSPPPQHSYRNSDRRKHKSSNLSRSRSQSRSLSRSRSPAPRQAPRDIERHTPVSGPEKKRRRSSSASERSYFSDTAVRRDRNSRERTSSRSTRRRFNQQSPPCRGRNSMAESRSPDRRRRRLSNDRRRSDDLQRPSDRRWSSDGHGTNFSNSAAASQNIPKENQRPRGSLKERSLSPFSKRLALTQAMNMR